MKNLKNFINEAVISDDKVYGVFFDDGTMYNFYYTPDDANYMVDKLNKEDINNNCKVIPINKDEIEC